MIGVVVLTGVVAMDTDALPVSVVYGTTTFVVYVVQLLDLMVTGTLMLFEWVLEWLTVLLVQLYEFVGETTLPVEAVQFLEAVLVVTGAVGIELV